MNHKSAASEFIESRLVELLLHGSEEHREWLKTELRTWIPALEELLEKQRQAAPSK